ncbi:hypothetical protein HQ29_02625 [Porphyromonas canoris]|uniref:hypothetical protein n=1 Tax=Porphyromonas TaxID=836 RepID=UPI00051DEAAA|nr:MULTISPECIES: hypothetical protein [Porphyromonas]KGL53024.1 hypothetical protein HQ29_02625 [Porphyromonas canoris]KGN95137.1 hypothetical protein HQ39_06380 [Porphyromonas sp. COT-108 OH2963]
MARKNLTITLHISEMIYDIQNKTFLTGRSKRDDGNHDKAAYMQANNDEEELNQILRSIGDHYNKLRSILSEYIEDSSSTASNNLISSSSNITLALSMPENYNSASANTIATEAHQYIVNKSIADWFDITNREGSATYLAKSQENVYNLIRSIHQRKRPVRS